MSANTISHISGQPGEQAGLYVGTITAIASNGDYVINHTLHCKRAISCLIKPESGDTVLTCVQGNRYYSILHILSREFSKTPGVLHLTPPDADKLVIQSKAISILGEKNVDITSLGSMQLSVCLGTLSIISKNLFKTVTDNLIENVRHHISTIEQYALTVTQLLRMHGRQQIITAEHDIKIDAERINMG